MEGSSSAAKLGAVAWVLRVAVGGTFLGHGLYCFTLRGDWLRFLTFWRIPETVAEMLMPLIGIQDLSIAAMALLRPYRPLLLYATVWAFLTALMRPVTGQSWWEFAERSANWGAPLALWLYLGAVVWGSKARSRSE